MRGVSASLALGSIAGRGDASTGTDGGAGGGTTGTAPGDRASDFGDVSRGGKVSAIEGAVTFAAVGIAVASIDADRGGADGAGVGAEVGCVLASRGTLVCETGCWASFFTTGTAFSPSGITSANFCWQFEHRGEKLPARTPFTFIENWQ
jgi:hypothetical protein